MIYRIWDGWHGGFYEAETMSDALNQHHTWQFPPVEPDNLYRVMSQEWFGGGGWEYPEPEYRLEGLYAAKTRGQAHYLFCQAQEVDLFEPVYIHKIPECPNCHSTGVIENSAGLDEYCPACEGVWSAANRTVEVHQIDNQHPRNKVKRLSEITHWDWSGYRAYFADGLELCGIRSGSQNGIIKVMVGDRTRVKDKREIEVHDQSVLFEWQE